MIRIRYKNTHACLTYHDVLLVYLRSTACLSLFILSTKTMPIQQRKGDNCYNADCSFEIARYALLGTEYVLSMFKLSHGII